MSLRGCSNSWIIFDDPRPLVKICLVGNARAVHLQRWAGAYAGEGHEVHIVSIRSESIDGATVHTTSVGPRNTNSPAWAMLSYAWLGMTIRRVIRRIDPDVVHAHYVTTSGVLARLSGHHHVVLTAWGSDVIPSDGLAHNRIVRALNAWALSGAQRVTSASVFMARRIKKDYPVREVTLVPFGVDTDLFSPRGGQRKESLRLGIVKSLNHKYGVDDAIRALPLIRRSPVDATLTIAGDGPLREDLARLACELGVSKHVHFLGRIRHQDVPDILREMDILLNPSVVPESFGVAIIEAEACGIPVVATDMGGIAETCLPGESALLVTPRNPQAIASAVADLSEAEVRHAFGVAGRRFVMERFSWDRSVASMMDVLREVGRP